MPELPEVETVCQGLRQNLRLPDIITKLEIRNGSLRRTVDPRLAKLAADMPLQEVTRRAKYLIFKGPEFSLINHLGMTGSWRQRQNGEKPGKHDHLIMLFNGQPDLIYRDPRRFGLMEYAANDELAAHRCFAHLGPEPLDPAFNPAYLRQQLNRRSGAIKAAIMDQKVVVGVGNIYAAESLFRAGIRPMAKASNVSLKRLTKLHAAIVEVLTAAIQAGGSTIRDFRQAGGSDGYFQHNFQVYGREGEDCVVCGATIRGMVIGGRASAHCPRCQR